MRERAGQHGKGVGNRRGGDGKCVEKRKKILNRRNELNKSFRINKSAKKETQNERFLGTKKAKTNAKMWPGIQVLYDMILEFDGPSRLHQIPREALLERRAA
jgi:hypothetical protein